MRQLLRSRQGMGHLSFAQQVKECVQLPPQFLLAAFGFLTGLPVPFGLGVAREQ
jgi:hypothetical protein